MNDFSEEVQNFVKNNPNFSLKVNRVLCNINGHEILPDINILNGYLKSKHYAKSLDRKFDPTKYEDKYIVEYKKDCNKMFCKVTKTLLNRSEREIELHLRGVRYRVKLPKYEEKSRIQRERYQRKLQNKVYESSNEESLARKPGICEDIDSGKSNFDEDSQMSSYDEESDDCDENIISNGDDNSYEEGHDGEIAEDNHKKIQEGKNNSNEITIGNHEQNLKAPNKKSKKVVLKNSHARISTGKKSKNQKIRRNKKSFKSQKFKQTTK